MMGSTEDGEGLAPSMDVLLSRWGMRSIKVAEKDQEKQRQNLYQKQIMIGENSRVAAPVAISVSSALFCSTAHRSSQTDHIIKRAARSRRIGSAHPSTRLWA